MGSAEKRMVAVLVSGPALSAIIEMVLRAVPGLRVRVFETRAALAAYLRIAPLDLLIADFDCEAAPADELALGLRVDAGERRFPILALATQVGPDTRKVMRHAGIDEVVVKPMSPAYLVERATALLARRPAPERRTTAPKPLLVPALPSNVIPLFGREPSPQH